MVHVALLRGINLGTTRRMPMASLRELLSEAGYAEVRTYIQSGNVVLDAAQTPARLEAALGTIISEHFGFRVPVVVRSRFQLAKVVARDPFADVVNEPKCYQVSFLGGRLPAQTAQRLQALATASERVSVYGREIYAWHPEGVARSKLWNALAGGDLGVTATARNWTTVRTLLQMAGG